MKKVLIALTATLMAVLCAYIVHRCVGAKRTPRGSDQIVRCQFENRSRMFRVFGRRGWTRTSVSSQKVQVDVALSNALARSFIELNNAYVNSSVDDLDSFVASVPSAITNVTDKVFSDLCKPIYRRVYSDFWHIDQLHEFVNKLEFNRYCKKHIDVSRFLANMRLRRQEYGSVLPRVEADVLVVLKRYKEQFDRNGMVELSLCATKFIDDWILQIESDNGFTRQYMLADVALQLLPCNNAEINCRQLLKSVRHGADALSRAGYTPKWLDEEFSLPNNLEDASLGHSSK